MLVLIVDDHALIRDALRGTLDAFDEVGGIIEAATATEAASLLEETPTIGLVLLDLGLPDRNGLSLLKSIRQAHPTVSVVVLSASEESSDMSAVLEAGAAGFIPKSAMLGVLQGALKLVFSGGIYVPPEILTPTPNQAAAQTSNGTIHAAKKLGLTERQIEVLSYVMQGKSNKVICRALDITEPTVKNHVTAILRALNVSNRTEAVIAASALGI